MSPMSFIQRGQLWEYLGADQEGHRVKVLVRVGRLVVCLSMSDRRRRKIPIHRFRPHARGLRLVGLPDGTVPTEQPPLPPACAGCGAYEHPTSSCARAQVAQVRAWREKQAARGQCRSCKKPVHKARRCVAHYAAHRASTKGRS